MGKRELILIAVFGLLGVLVYQLMAPPPAPGEQGFSLSRIVDNVRREVRGNQASAEATKAESYPVAEAVTELRVNVLRGPITIVGEARDTLESELHVRSTGYDVAEATSLANQTNLALEQTGSLLIARVEFPTAGRQTATLTLRVPARLHIRLEGPTSRLAVSGVASVEAAQSQGETTIRGIAGRVTVSHRGGKLLIADTGSLKLTTRGSSATLERIRGEAEISTQAGELDASGIAGPVELSASATRVTLQGAEARAEAMRVAATGGALTMTGVSAESRIDIRNASLEMEMARPAAVAVFSEGGESVRVTTPAGGFNLDAHAREGRITGEPADLFTRWGIVAGTPDDGTGERLTGSVGGGGPLLTIRSRGDIRISAK